MGKPPEGGGRLLVLAAVVLLIIVQADAQLSQDYGCPSQEKILPCRCSTRGMEFQIWCSHSELPSVLQGLNAVSHYVTRPVDELILENNNLPSLPGKVFTSLRVLRLMLRNNRLERVSSGWLEGLHDSLLELFIVEPDLRSLPVDSLDNLQGLEAITLQSKSMKRLPRFSGLTKLHYLQVNSPALLELSPMHFRDLPNLEQLHVFGSPRLARLEAGLFRNLPKLSLVNISDSGIAWIHPRALIGLPELKEISLIDNMISDASIVGRATVDLPALTVINLDGNRVTRLSESSFVDNPSLNRLSLARNHISEILPGAFQRLSLLRILDLNHNRIRRIHPEFFLQRTGSGLEELWLIDNELAHVNELRAVLEALPGLKFLDVSYNLLEGIPFGALRGHPTLERLHLDHNRLGFLQRESFAAMPALRELRLRNNSLTNLLEAPFWNLPGLKGLDLSENYFRHLEPRLLTNLPNLRRLDLSGNGIALVEPESFMASPALEHLNLSGNALSVIHPLTFRHLTNLYELDVGWNRLLEIVPGLPRNIEHLHLPMNRIVSLPSLASQDLALPTLRTFDVSANGIERILPGTLSELPALRKLNLGYNALRILEDGTFDGLARLDQLDLRYNRLVSLHGRSLKPLRSLMDLNLRGNRLEVIRPDLFQENSQLQRLDISRNNLAQIPNPTFSNTRDLRELYASHNTLTELPGSLHGLNALEVLDLSFNKLNILSPETLSSLTSLLELKLVRNKIKELREGAFDRLPRLSFIDLENNDLRIIERNAIRALPELQALRLGKNRLRMIPSGAFSELPLLQSAELQENRIQEIAPNAFVNVPHLLFLNLSHNQLPEIAYVGLESLRSLEVLDLSNNRLSRVSDTSLAAMEWLVELKMDNNRICSIQGSPFNDMPRLRVLSLRSNRMTSVSEKAFQRLRSNIAVLDIDGNPLSCSCGMLWLRGWLQQASSDGPRCADGSLFREIRLSRQDCLRSRQVEPVHPGCEAETIDQSSSLVSSTLYGGKPAADSAVPSWMNLRDPPKDPQSSQNVDYFVYEDYMDYQYGNTTEVESSQPVQSTTISAPSAANLVTSQALTSLPEVATTSASTLSTPNLARPTQPTKNKNSAIPPSPSSSGFTFFGVPLPSLNFNLWGNSGSRKSQRKEDNPTGRPGRSRYRVFPPTEPEIHRGGFVPLPQGQGGFVPIPDPRLVYEMKMRNETSRFVNRTATITRVQHPPERRKNTKVPLTANTKIQQLAVRGKLTAKDREELTTARSDTAALSSATNSRRVASNLTKSEQSQNSYKVTESEPEVVNSTTTTQLYENDSLEPEETIIGDGKVANKIVWTTLSSVEVSNKKHESNDKAEKKEKEKEDEEGEDNNDDESFETYGGMTKDSSRVKKISLWDLEERLPPGKHISAEDDEEFDYSTEDLEEQTSEVSSTSDLKASTESSDDETNSNSTPQSNQILEASALSALLIPGGQISAASAPRLPSGRSTITRIASPHLSLTADRAANGSSSKLLGSSGEKNNSVGSEIEGKIDLKIVNENSGEDSLEASVKIIEDNPFNWYFKNYNDSNIEPFVAVVEQTASGARERIISLRWTLLIFQTYFAIRAYQ